MDGLVRRVGRLIPRSRLLLVIALAALAVGLLQALDLIELPFAAFFSGLSGTGGSSSSLGSYLSKYGYASLFGLMALESASLPIPSEVVLPYAGYLVKEGLMSFWPAVLVSTAASLAGALVDYYLAALLGRPFVVRLLKAFGLHTFTLEGAEKWFSKWGQWTVFVARFVPGLRTIISLPAGLFEMRLRDFVVMTVTGCFAWSVILIYAGVLAGAQWNDAFSSTTVIDALSGLVAAVSAAYVVYYAATVRRSGSVTPVPSSVS